MLYRSMKWAGVTVLAAVAGVAILAVATVSARAQDVPQISGVWKLNVEASVNPNGPGTGVARGGRSGTPRAGGEGGAGAVGSGGPPPGGDLGQEEMQRFMAMRQMFFTAPPMMGLQATPTEFNMLLDPAKNYGYKHKTDNKKETLVTPTGPADFKVKWDGKKIRREIETKESLHVVEEYSLSPDGKQLTVTVKADSRMVRGVQSGDIKRVYDRQQ